MNGATPRRGRGLVSVAFVVVVVVVSVVFVVGSGGCFLFAGEVACTTDANCPTGQRCDLGLKVCTSTGGEGEGEGEGAGEGEGEGAAEGEGEGEGEGADPCGDGVLDVGESCEDGNRDPGDGCAGCQPEPGFSCPGGLFCFRTFAGDKPAGWTGPPPEPTADLDLSGCNNVAVQTDFLQVIGCGATVDLTVLQPDGTTDVAVLSVRNLTTDASTTIIAQGSKGFALVVFGDATFAAGSLIDFSGQGHTSGPGAQGPCAGVADGAGTSGGQGGLRNGAGGVGGGQGGGAGPVTPPSTFVGGCAGGATIGATGGGGGGAFALAVSGSLVVQGHIDVAGGGGGAGIHSATPGAGGGGSGGLLVLEGHPLTFTDAALLNARGGGGGCGATSAVDGSAGADGGGTGLGCVDTANTGGDGAPPDGAPVQTDGTAGAVDGNSGSGGGGGGGGAGEIHLVGFTGCGGAPPVGVRGAVTCFP